MASAYKVLGKLSPANTTAATLYTVPASTDAIVSSIFVCNITSSQIAFDIALIPSGDTLSADNYIYFNVILPGRDTFIINGGISLDAGDIINVKTYTANSITFIATGVELT